MIGTYHHHLYASPVVYAAVVLVFLASVIFRRIYFHPYRHVPGPLLAKITSGYSAWHSWRGSMHLDVQRCHERYGTSLPWNNILIQIQSADAGTNRRPETKAIYGHGAPFRKSKGYATMCPVPGGWTTMTSIDKPLNQRLRRVFRAGTGAKQLAKFEPAILRRLKICLDQLQVDNGWSRSADMRRWSLCLGFDTMADFGLGIETNLLRSSDRDFVFPPLHFHEKKLGLWEQLPALNNVGLGILVSAAYPVVSPKARRFYKWCLDFLDRASERNRSESRGIFGPVIQSGHGNLSPAGHNRAQMMGESFFSVSSSAEPYAILLSGFFHYLGHYRQVYERLAGEMRSLYGPGEDIVWDAKLESNVYLRAVINELLRLLPPACGVHWRECEAPGVSVGPDQTPVSVGSDAGMSIFSLFRDGRLYREPLRFWPERWLPGVLPEDEFRTAKKAFTPFLIGPRNCAGGHISIMMASIAFAYTLVNADFRLGPEQADLVRRRSETACRHVGAEFELAFASHSSITCWESGPFIQFSGRATEKSVLPT
ncbi:hypothetical protein L249_1855 [Ophiocordyceps polyrhachis-furcata BCC 54312]|uniref:Cytochrome P450 n=1 Tax=Ophiocordyceps polyrhachis-furcata BCC 54312 TaxID=1330021 RepID=A0A367LPF7_9HYPO|nr:hypothetical protein L249_1855 [Ophiocordyceps polyrhachis-furcata BCC 54312]